MSSVTDPVTAVAKRRITRAQWEKLAGFADEVALQDWLELQCRLIPAATLGLVARRAGDGRRYDPIAVWPMAAGEVLEPVAVLIDQVIEARSGLIMPLDGAGEESQLSYGVALPIVVQDTVEAVVALGVSSVSEDALRDALQQLEWGSAWVELALRRAGADVQHHHQDTMAQAMTLLSRVLAEDDFDAGAMRLVAELSRSADAELVSLGLRRRAGVRLEYLSNSARFSKEMNLVRAIEASMDETVDAQEALRWPLPSRDGEALAAPADHAHRDLSRLQKDAALLTLPLYRDQECIGAVGFQRPTGQAFSDAELTRLESVVALASAALALQRENARGLGTRLAQAGAGLVKRLLGAGYWRWKLAAIALAALGVFLGVAQGDYRVSADATLVARAQRVIVAPYDGFIADAPISAGDQVDPGQLIVAFDTRDLDLEKLKWESQRTRLQREYQDALAGLDRSRINILEAQLEQAQAQLALVDAQLERARQLAPFEGLVVSGDLQQRLGGAVTKGETLFELAPVDSYRVHLQVPESRIADLHEGQAGTLYLSALPDQPFPIEVDRIRPVAQTDAGGSVFLVEATLASSASQLRPGMEGVGRVDVDERRLISIWLRSALDWWRLQVWTHLG